MSGVAAASEGNYVQRSNEPTAALCAFLFNYDSAARRGRVLGGGKCKGAFNDFFHSFQLPVRVLRNSEPAAADRIYNCPSQPAIARSRRDPARAAFL